MKKQKCFATATISVTSDGRRNLGRLFEDCATLRADVLKVRQRYLHSNEHAPQLAMFFFFCELER